MTPLSIVIITWNQRATLLQCLESLHATMQRSEVEVIVVDNGSSDGTVDHLRANYPDIKLLCLDKNMGVAYARNRGIEAASRDYLLLLDNDTIASFEAIAGMANWLDSHPDCGLCACRLVDHEGVVQESFKPFPGLFVKIRNVLGISQPFAEPTQPIHPTYVIGACQMVRRSIFSAIGLLDERIFYGPEDADFCLRIAATGKKITYLPQFTITHLWRRATTRSICSPLAISHTKALIYFYCKHHRLN